MIGCRQIALAGAAMLAAVGLHAAPAAAQQARLELGGRTLALGALEAGRLSELRQALNAAPSIQDNALASARESAQSPDARYVLAIYQLEIGQRRRDDALRVEALDVLIASRDTPADRLAGFLGLRGEIAYRARDFAMASVAWTRLAEMRPNDPQALMNLAQVRAAQSDGPGAVELIRRASAMMAGRSEPVPEIWHRQWLSIAYNGHLAEQTSAAAHALVEAHPTAENWRLALVAIRQLAAPQGGAEIDLFRLMRAVGALRQGPEYLRLAQLLVHAGQPAEARAVLDDGIARGLLSRTEPPTPQIIAEIGRAADGPPAPIVVEAAGAAGVRRGAALALAGDRAAAEAAFRAVTSGEEVADRFYADLAGFWLAWLARPSGS